MLSLLGPLYFVYQSNVGSDEDLLTLDLYNYGLSHPVFYLSFEMSELDAGFERLCSVTFFDVILSISNSSLKEYHYIYFIVFAIFYT